MGFWADDRRVGPGGFSFPTLEDLLSEMVGVRGLDGLRVAAGLGPATALRSLSRRAVKADMSVNR